MRTKTITANGVLYENDFLAWTEQTAASIRAGRFDELALEVLAEEIEDLGNSQYKEAWSRLYQLVKHLLKWKYQPDKRSSSWDNTIDEQRLQLRLLFKSAPSLKGKILIDFDEIYAYSLRRAIKETKLPTTDFPSECPFTLEQILDEDFLPG